MSAACRDDPSAIQYDIAQQEPVADIVVPDDNAARRTAEFLGLKVTGTIGTLVKARQNGIIQQVKSLLNEIMQNGFIIIEIL